jgi:hypothetical protein
MITVLDTMEVQKDDYSVLIEKLDAFIRKYYKNQLIRGSIYCLSVFLFFGIAASVMEFFGHFGILMRTLLFYSFILLNVLIVSKLILLPLFRLYKLGAVISYEEAAEIIGTHFMTIQDRILNTIQLRHSLDHNQLPNQNQDLILAGINQKIAALKPVPFNMAIDFSVNKKYLKYLIIPLVLLFVLLFSSPGIITESTARLIDHRNYYSKPAPFDFVVCNKNLLGIQEQDFQLTVTTKGKVLPSEMFIELEGKQFRLDHPNKLYFNYLFKNLQKRVSFRLFSEGVYSQNFDLKVVAVPLVLNFDLTLEFPEYLHKREEALKNNGDLVLPAGTSVKWVFHTLNTDGLEMVFKEGNRTVLTGRDQYFSHTKKWFKSDQYAVKVFNKDVKRADSILYSVTVIPDVFPSISVEENKDSVDFSHRYFNGLVKDDYGFSKLAFNLLIHHKDSIDANSEKVVKQEISLPVSSIKNQDSFYFYFDFSTNLLAPGDFVEYFFEVWDNDGLNGIKSTKSQVLVYKMPSAAEMAQILEKGNQSIKSGLNESLQEVKKLQKDLSEYNKKLFEKKELAWDDKKKVKELLNREKILDDKIHEAQQEHLKNMQQQSGTKENSEGLQKKQKMLNEMMDKVLTEDMKKMLQDMQQLLDKVDKTALQEVLDKLKKENKDVEKELDRSLAIFKQLEFSQKMQESIKQLDALEQKQTALAKEALQKLDPKTLEEKQEKLNNDFKNIEKALKDLEDKNAQLEFKENFKNPEDDSKSIESDMKESLKSLNENRVQKAGQSQKAAAAKIAKLADKLKKLEADDEAGQVEDSNALRAVLENLLRLSFNEEQLLMDVKSIAVNDPKYLLIAPQQRVLKDDATLIEDSLLALSKRVIQIKSFVNREISRINQNIGTALANLEDRQPEQARMRQQYIMTSVNNLALMLSEILDSMQQQMAKANDKSKPGGQSSCKKPGSGSPSLSSLRLKQEQMNKQMKEIMEGKSGAKGTKGDKASSEQIAQLAAKQAMLRNELGKLNQEQNYKGKNSIGNLNKISEQMEQSETDLVNKVLNQNVFNRQQEILGRLLESEKAEKEREQDTKRESNEAKNTITKNSPQLELYKKQKLKEMEMLRTVPPSLNPFYKKIVNAYFQRINE